MTRSCSSVAVYTFAELLFVRGFDEDDNYLRSPSRCRWNAEFAAPRLRRPTRFFGVLVAATLSVLSDKIIAMCQERWQKSCADKDSHIMTAQPSVRANNRGFIWLDINSSVYVPSLQFLLFKSQAWSPKNVDPALRFNFCFCQGGKTMESRLYLSPLLRGVLTLSIGS